MILLTQKWKTYFDILVV